MARLVIQMFLHPLSLSVSANRKWGFSANDWNSLDSSLREVPSLSIFKRGIVKVMYFLDLVSGFPRLYAFQLPYFVFLQLLDFILGYILVF